MTKIRLFLAVNLPGELKNRLGVLQERFKKLNVNVKWVEVQNLHLTIKFLGEVNTSLVSAINKAVQGAASGMEHVALSFQGMGFFPEKKKPRILWVGVDGDVDALRELHRKVQQSLFPLGFPPDSRRFSPHLTIGRLRSLRGSTALVEEIERVNAKKEKFGIVSVKSIDLMQSRLTRSGPIYTVLESFEFCKPE